MNTQKYDAPNALQTAHVQTAQISPPTGLSGPSAVNLSLAEPATIRVYFERIQQLAQTGEAFPVDLDEVWPLVYSRKDKAVRALRKDFFEGQDFISLPLNGERSTVYVSPPNGENPKGGRPEQTYRLSTSCLEYFIARKVREVFEVYRAVFHRALATAAVAAPAATDPLVLQILQTQTQLLSGQQTQLDQLRADIARIQAGRTRPRKAPAAGPNSLSIPFGVASDPLTLRQQVNKRVNEYCGVYACNQNEAYKHLYKRMFSVWGIDVYALVRQTGESIIEAVERYRLLDRLYSIVVSELTVPDQL